MPFSQPLRFVTCFCLSLFVGVAFPCSGHADDENSSDSVATSPEQLHPSGLHLFLLAGQSNMAGRGKIAEEDLQPHPRVLVYNKAGDWVPAIAPLHFDKPGISGVGLGRTFAIEYAENHPDAIVGLIPCAVGGTSLDVWQPSGFHESTQSHPYDDCLERMQQALVAGDLKGILWHQGESDSNPNRSKGYQAKLDELFLRFRQEWRSHDVPIIVGQLGKFPEKPWNEDRTRVNQAHQTLPQRMTNTAFVHSDGLQHKGDETHFSAEAYREFGHRYFQAFQQLSVSGATGQAQQVQQTLQRLRVSPNGETFVESDSGKAFAIWGVNYDHDESGRLLDEYWIDEWDKVVEDFGEIKQLGANCVRIHLQLGLWMKTPDQVSPAQAKQLERLLELAESKRLYLDITGLACYHKSNIPNWLNDLNEIDRWKVQAKFWSTVANVCKDSPAVFCYDLMNEPILPGETPESDWLAGELGGKFFVQRLALNRNGRSRQEIATAWVNQMVDAIREQDPETMVTVGVIPWVFAFGGGKPLFYSPQVGERLDFVSVHFYPEKGEVQKALDSLTAYEIGKPLVVEEMFPLKCSTEELSTFVLKSQSHVDGWISFYWGATAQELHAKDKAGIAEAITAEWLDAFQQLRGELKASTVP